MALGPVVAGARLAEDEVVRPEDLAVRSRADAVHGARLQVDQDGARHVLAAAGLVVVDVDALQLQLRLATVDTVRLDAVLVRDDLPELHPSPSQLQTNTSLGLCPSGQRTNPPPGTWLRPVANAREKRSSYLGADLVAALADLNVDDFAHSVDGEFNAIKAQQRFRFRL